MCQLPSPDPNRLLRASFSASIRARAGSDERITGAGLTRDEANHYLFWRPRDTTAPRHRGSAVREARKVRVVLALVGLED